MATQAHCAFCFETIAAHFERRQALNLSQVEELWEEYHATTGRSLPLHDDDEEDDMSDAEAEAETSSTAQPAAISRLHSKESAQSATSSSSSLPSNVSGVSSIQSNNASGRVTPASSMSSRTSLSSSTQSKYPLFVTWNTISRSGNKSLRGCIGTFEAQELEKGLRSYALTSAFEDTRFQPIPASLFPSLAAHVTLLTNFSQPTQDPLDWTIGKHGIRIRFTYHNRGYGATYLPDVAKEQGWTKEEALISLMRKAGWSGSSGSWQKHWRDGKGELVRYEGKQVGLEYKDWKEWRDWVEGQGVEGGKMDR